MIFALLGAAVWAVCVAFVIAVLGLTAANWREHKGRGGRIE